MAFSIRRRPILARAGLLLLAVLALVLLSACNSGASAPAAAPTVAATATEEQAATPAATEEAVMDETATEPPTSAADTDETDNEADEPDTSTDDEEAPGVASAEAGPTNPTAAPPTPEPTTAPPTATPARPVTLGSGSFITIDNLHAGQGTATLVQQPDGTHILRLDENFSVTFGPDLFVWLSGHPQPTNGDEAAAQGYVDLGGLQSRSGAQEYIIPAEVDTASFQSAVIWCRAFGAVMSSAPLTAE